MINQELHNKIKLVSKVFNKTTKWAQGNIWGVPSSGWTIKNEPTELVKLAAMLIEENIAVHEQNKVLLERLEKLEVKSGEI